MSQSSCLECLASASSFRPDHTRLCTFCAAAVLALFCTLPASAATLHGRVKDQQCSVLSKAKVHIRSANLDRTVVTDDSGNYTADLPAGEYQLCIQRDPKTAATCSPVVLQQSGDKYITTQLRDAAPDLSNIGNKSY